MLLREQESNLLVGYSAAAIIHLLPSITGSIHRLLVSHVKIRAIFSDGPERFTIYQKIYLTNNY